MLVRLLHSRRQTGYVKSSLDPGSEHPGLLFAVCPATSVSGCSRCCPALLCDTVQGYLFRRRHLLYACVTESGRE